EGGGGRRAGFTVDGRELPEQLAGADHGDETLAAVGAEAGDLHTALDDQTDPVRGVALVEQRGARAEAARAPLLANQGDVDGVHGPKRLDVASRLGHVLALPRLQIGGVSRLAV